MQWRKNRIAIGSVIFVALLGLTLWAVASRDQVRDSAERPTLEIDRESVSSIEIARPKDGGTDLVILSKTDGDWRVTVPLEAEVDATSVEAALSRLASMRVAGVAATRPENYARLEVDDAQAIKVVVHTGEANAPLTLRFGKYGNGNTMVRIDDRTEVFSVDGSVRYPFDKDLDSWRKRQVTELAIDEIQRVTFNSPNGVFGFYRNEGSWEPVATQARIKDFDPNQVEGLVSTAARLTATGFAPSEVSSARAGLGGPNATVTLEVIEPSGAGSGGEPGSAPSELETETVVLEIGDETTAGTEFFLRRQGDQTVYVVSKYLADRLRPTGAAFEKMAEPPPPPAGGAPLGAPPGAPPGQQPQLPPEIMQQIQEQLRQQQQQAP